jgi:hypothetical protein
MDATNKEQDDPILQMRGVGKEIWADTDPDEYVHDLRSNWDGTERSEGGVHPLEDRPTRL